MCSRPTAITGLGYNHRTCLGSNVPRTRKNSEKRSECKGLCSEDLVEMPMHLANRRCQHAAMAVLLELPWILAAGGIGLMWISRKRYLRSNVLEPSAVRLKLRVNLLFTAIQCPQRTSTVLGKKMSLSWRLARSLLSGSHQNHFPDKNCGCALQDVGWEYPTSA